MIHRFMRPDWEDTQRYKMLYNPELWHKGEGFSDNQYIHDKRDFYALEQLLGRHVDDDDFGEKGKLSSTDTLRKLGAWKARRAFAEYLLRSRSAERPVNDHSYDDDAIVLSLLSFKDRDNFGDVLKEYVSDYDIPRYSALLTEIADEVPDVLYSNSNANDFKDKKRQEARETAEEAGVTYENKYGDTVDDGIKHGKYTSWNVQELNDSLKNWPIDPLLTQEERAALLNNNVTDALKDLKY